MDGVRNCDAVVQPRLHVARVSHRTGPILVALEPAASGECAGRAGTEYRRFVYDEYKLAVLRAGSHDVVPDPDDRACVHNFTSAAVGMALAIAFIRGISRREQNTLGNFWVDSTRAILWILLPISIVLALALVSQGVVQNLHPYSTAHLVESQNVTAPDSSGKPVTQTITTQSIAQGPVASQEAIKMLGTNGGGFFNTNSAHPFENPTPFSNLLEMLAIFAIPAGLTVTMGRMARSPLHGWAVFAAMAILFVAGVTTAYWAEARGNPMMHGVAQQTTLTQAGGNMEGKEVRFGIANTALFATVTTDASCGAVNGMHDSFTPLGGMVPMVNIMLGEIVFGGVGAGMYGMLIFVVLSVFIEIGRAHV